MNTAKKLPQRAALRLVTPPKAAKATKQAENTDGYAVQLASEYRAAYLKAEDIKATVEVKRAALLDHVGGMRDEDLRNGKCDNTVKVSTLDGERVLVMYQEKYRALDEQNIEPLKAAFGNAYELYVEETISVGLQPGTTLNAIEQIIGTDALEALLPLLSVTCGVKPRKGAFGHIAALYRKGDIDTAEDLSSFVDATVAEPSVRAK